MVIIRLSYTLASMWVLAGVRASISAYILADGAAGDGAVGDGPPTGMAGTSSSTILFFIATGLSISTTLDR